MAQYILQDNVLLVIESDLVLAVPHTLGVSSLLAVQRSISRTTIITTGSNLHTTPKIEQFLWNQ